MPKETFRVEVVVSDNPEGRSFAKVYMVENLTSQICMYLNQRGAGKHHVSVSTKYKKGPCERQTNVWCPISMILEAVVTYEDTKTR